MPEPLPDDDVVPFGDPFEAELVAYLDGELDAAAARKVETRLATDAQARAKAAAYKKTFDLLDYLPKPEPSPTFTTRTLDKLPVMAGSSPPQQKPQAGSGPQAARPPRLSQPVPAASRGGMPLPGSSAVLELTPERGNSSRWLWAAGILLAVTGFAGAGYLGGMALRSSQHNSRSSTGKEPAEEVGTAERRVIENLPLYGVLDDYAFLNELARTEYFGDDPAVLYDSTLKVPTLPPDAPSATTYAHLEKSFHQLAPERQQVLRELDRRLYSDAPPVRDRLLRVLEAYVVWLNALPEGDRRTILAATPAFRLQQIRETRDRQWLDSLPPSQRAQATGANGSLNTKLIEEWKANELKRREEWKVSHKHPELLDPGRTPWPFDTEGGRREVIAFAKEALRLDDPKLTRLSANEQDRYAAALKFAQENGGAAWYPFGQIVFELCEKQKDMLLPPPEDLKKRYATMAELPPAYQIYTKPTVVRDRLEKLAGKWPELPLELHRDIPEFHKKSKLKLDMPQTPLGPSHVSEFVAPVKTFIETELMPKLKNDEKKALLLQDGKWPEFSRELVRLSRVHNLSMPGVMLPGKPDRWELQYGSGRVRQQAGSLSP